MTTKFADPLLVLDLETVNGAMLDLVGAKAANLGELIGAAAMPPGVASAVAAAYAVLDGGPEVPVAVRSSATAEDLPTASRTPT